MARNNKSKLLSRQGQPWSEKNVNFLLNKAGLWSAKAIARQLRRSVKAVRRKSEKLGISLAVK